MLNSEKNMQDGLEELNPKRKAERLELMENLVEDRKKRRKIANKKYNNSHKHLIAIRKRKWKDNNKESVYEYRKNYYLKNPWMITYTNIHKRCEVKSFSAYKWYGAKGIKRLITVDELKQLWLRDKASAMKHPSIDRINPMEDYTFLNCRYIERSENTERQWALKLGLTYEQYIKRRLDR